MARRKRPEPRQPTALPVTIVEAEEAIIQAEVNAWRRSLEERITSVASHRFIEADLLRQLELHEQGCPALEPREIVDMAEGGHPPADHALRHFISRGMEADRFQQMPTSIRNYARRSLSSAPLAIEYPSRAPQVVSNLTRDIAVCLLVDMVVARRPAVPRLYSTPRRRSAAYYVGTAFMLTERQTARICQSRDEMSRRLATFMIGYARTS